MILTETSQMKRLRKICFS